MKEQNLIINIKDKIASLTMNRGVQRNALHPDLIHELSDTFSEFEKRNDINVIVLTGQGPAFCAGLDLEYLSGLSCDERVIYMRSAFRMFQQLYRLPQPTIAAVNGPAVAGGFDLAIFCDLRTSTPESIFAQPEIILGVTQFMFPLYTHIGLGRTKELALTGTPIDAKEAHRIGLVNHLYSKDELLPNTIELASTLASRPRETLLTTKQLGLTLAGLDSDSAFKVIGDELDKSLRSETHQMALQNYLNTRHQK